MNSQTYNIHQVILRTTTDNNQNLTPKILGLAIDPQQTSQRQPHVLFVLLFTILFYPKS